MIDLKRGFDTEVDHSKCDWCQHEIFPGEELVLYGTGNSLAVILHLACALERDRDWFKVH